MSWEASAWARKQRGLDPTEKLLLLLVADFCDDRGFCWPSVKKLAEEIGVEVRTVQRSLSKLEDVKKLIRRDPRWREDGSRTTNGIQLLMGGVVTPASGGGDNMSPGGVTAVSPHEPISKNHTTPPVAPKGATKKKAPRRQAMRQAEMEAHELYPTFDQIWKELPSRLGSDPKTTAFCAFLKTVALEKLGPNELQQMLQGAQRYAVQCDALGKTGTETVMQGSRFFGPERNWAQEWPLPGKGHLKLHAGG